MDHYISTTLSLFDVHDFEKDDDGSLDDTDGAAIASP